MTFFITLFIILMQFLWKYVDDLVGKGLEWYVILKLLFYAAMTFVPLALPLAILLASLMTFGNLGETYQLSAMKAAGISLKKIMMPLVVLSVIISVSAFYFSNNILPIANLKFRSILYDIKSQKPAFNIKQGIFYNGIDGYTLKIDKKDKDGKTIHDIIIYDHTDRMGDNKITIAKSGKMLVSPDKKKLILYLYDGYNYIENTSRKNKINRPFQRIKFEEEYRRFYLTGNELNRTDESLFKNDYHMLNIRQLSETADSLKIQLKDYKNKFMNFYNRKNKYYSLIDTNEIVIPDTAKILNNDFLTNFKPSEQKKIISQAIKNSRAIKRNIEFRQKVYKSKETRIIKHQLEWHKKFTLSFACLIFFFIGAPLGAIIRKGGLGTPLVISVFFFVFWHVITIISEKYVKASIITPALGSWIASVIILPLGIFLTYKATSDSSLLDMEWYIKFIKKINKIIYKRFKIDLFKYEDTDNL